MLHGKFVLPGLAETEVSVSRIRLDAASPLNQNDPHIHRECEIYINLSGDVAFEVENRVYPVTRGSVILTRPYEYHRCIYRSDQPHDHWWITFFARETEPFLNMFFDREKGSANRIVLEEQQLCQLCDALTELLQSEDALSRRIVFLQALRILSAGARQSEPQPGQGLPGDVAAALRIMDEHLEQELCIGELAAACGVSVNTMERHFKTALGALPATVLRKKRLIASMRYLRSGDTVTEAAAKSGFFDYSAYIQLFKKQFGVTPGKFRKEFLQR